MKLLTPRPHLAALALALGAPALAQEPDPSALLEAVVPEIAEPLDEKLLLSGSLAVGHRGEIVHRASWGMANYELAVPNGPATRFCIASVSKPITALAVARLVGEGRLDLEATVDTWIEGLPSGDEMTLMQLMQHRAGIPHRVTGLTEQTVPFTAEMIVDRMRSRSLIFAPGTDQAYSTAGYSIVARIIEIVTGKDYDAAMRELIFEPFGMDSTCHVSSEVLLPGRAQCYVRSPGGFSNAPLQDLSFLVGGGSLYSTAEDLVRFGMGCIERTALPAETWNVFAHQLGWAGSNPIAWNGKTNQFGAFLDLHLTEDLVVAFTGNAGVGAGVLLRQAIPDVVAGNELPELTRFSDRSFTTETAAPYVGDYVRDDGIRTTLLLEAGMLQTDRGGIFLPTEDGQFFSPTYGCGVTFDLDAEGRVEALVYRPVGMGPIIFKRVGR